MQKEVGVKRPLKRIALYLEKKTRREGDIESSMAEGEGLKENNHSSGSWEKAVESQGSTAETLGNCSHCGPSQKQEKAGKRQIVPLCLKKNITTHTLA